MRRLSGNVFHNFVKGCTRGLSEPLSIIFRDTPKVLSGTTHPPCVPHFVSLLFVCSSACIPPQNLGTHEGCYFGIRGGLHAQVE